MALKKALAITAIFATAYNVAECDFELQRFPKYKTYGHAFRHRYGLHTVEKYDGSPYKLCSSSYPDTDMYMLPIAERCVDCNRCYRDENLFKQPHYFFKSNTRKDASDPLEWIDSIDTILNTNITPRPDGFPVEYCLTRTPPVPKSVDDRLPPSLIRPINETIRLYGDKRYVFYISDLPTSISFSHRADITSAHLKALKYVSTLSLCNCQGITDISVLGMGSVKKLDLSFCDGVTDISALGQCEHLHTLELVGCKGITDISALGQCEYLHTLDLWGCKGVVDISSLGQCKCLHTLSLSGCKGVTDVSALGQCEYLHTLDLWGCTGVTDVSMLKDVHRLNLNGCTGITDVSALGQSKCLHTLDLTGCDNLSIDCVYALANVKNLTLPKHIVSV